MDVGDPWRPSSYFFNERVVIGQIGEAAQSFVALVSRWFVTVTPGRDIGREATQFRTAREVHLNASAAYEKVSDEGSARGIELEFSARSLARAFDRRSTLQMKILEFCASVISVLGETFAHAQNCTHEPPAPDIVHL